MRPNSLKNLIITNSTPEFTIQKFTFECARDFKYRMHTYRLLASTTLELNNITISMSSLSKSDARISTSSSSSSPCPPAAPSSGWMSCSIETCAVGSVSNFMDKIKFSATRNNASSGQAVNLDGEEICVRRFQLEIQFMVDEMYILPINCAAIYQRREYAQTVLKRIADGRKGQRNAKVFADAFDEKAVQGERRRVDGFVL